MAIRIPQKVNRKVQGGPQLQIAANPGYQEEEKNDKTKTNTYKTNKQMHEKHTDQLSLWVQKSPRFHEHIHLLLLSTSAVFH